MPVLRVEPAAPADIPALGRLGALLVSLHHGFDPKRFLPAERGTEAGYASFLRRELDRPHAVILVARFDGAVIGYAYGGLEGIDYMSLRGPAGVIHDLVVDPEHRGRGAGRRLLDEMLNILEARGVSQIVLSTAYRNDGAQSFFKAAGFAPTMIEMTRQKSG